jgi:hypothetical protein
MELSIREEVATGSVAKAKNFGLTPTQVALHTRSEAGEADLMASRTLNNLRAHTLVAEADRAFKKEARNL